LGNDEGPGTGQDTGPSGDVRMPGANVTSIFKNHPSGSNDDFANTETRNFLGWELSPSEEERRAELYKAAYSLYRSGFRVIPLHWVTGGACSCGSPECKSPGKHPYNDRWNEPGPDPEADRRWWQVADKNSDLRDWHPAANIGVLTGEVSGIFVVDIDPKNGGTERWEELVAANGGIPATLIIQTGSGGRHYYFTWPGFRVGNYKPWGADSGIDIRGDGGQVVAPPSISVKGPYSYVETAAIADAPAWIIAALREHDKIQRGEPSRLSPAVAPNGVMRAYGTAAVKAQAFMLREAPQGERNNTLNRAAFALGQLAPAGIVIEGDAWAALSEAAAACGLGRNETLKTFRSGWQDGYAEPYYPQWKDQGVTWAARTWDEIGLGHRMIDRFADRLRWMPGGKTGDWWLYMAGVWRSTAADTGEQFALAMIESLAEDEAEHYSDDPGDGKESALARFEHWVAKRRNAASIRAAAAVARLNGLMRIDDAHCDTNLMHLNLRNGTWDAVERRMLPHDPDDMLTMQAAVSYDPEADCPGWLAFLERVQPDPEVRDYLQRIMGYSATGDTGEQVMFFHYGDKGANGKSVFHSVLGRILGDYAQTVPVETLIQTKMTGSVPTDIARMKGRRYLSASEAKEGAHLDEQAIKQLTGGETVAARFMRQDYFEFKPVGKIHLTSNDLPHVSDGPATWRRLYVIGWDVRIPEGDRDKKLADRLYTAEAPGILNWILQGMAAWMEQGLQPPASIIERTAQYRREEDRIEQWLADRVDINLGANLETGAKVSINSDLDVLHASFAEWFFQQTRRQSALDARKLSAKLQGKNFVKKRTSRGNAFPELTVRIPDPANDISQHIQPE
jgi:putative DNA primase/helicase